MMTRGSALVLLCVALGCAVALALAAEDEAVIKNEAVGDGAASKSKVQQHFLGGGFFPGGFGGARVGYPAVAVPSYPVPGVSAPGYLSPGYLSPGYQAPGYPVPGYNGALGGYYPQPAGNLPFVFYSSDKDRKLPGKDNKPADKQ